MKSRIIIISLLSMVIIIVLALTSKDDDNYIDTVHRKFNYKAIKTAERQTMFASYYIAEITNSMIYLGNYRLPYHTLAFSLNLSDSVLIGIQNKFHDNKKIGAMAIQLDSPNFFIVCPDSSLVLRGVITQNGSEWLVNTKISIDEDVTDLHSMAPNSFVFRSLDSARTKDVLVKAHSKKGDYQYRDILKKQIDGIFCVDGMLHYDKRNSQLIYLYYYRNQYMLIDTNLVVKGYGNTIDTISRARIKPAKIQRDNVFTMASPPLVVNNKSAIGNGKLYVQSNIIGASENMYRGDYVFDIYDFKLNTYEGSFRIVAPKDKKIRDFSVHGSDIYVIFDKSLVRYSLEKNEDKNVL